MHHQDMSTIKIQKAAGHITGAVGATPNVNTIHTITSITQRDIAYTAEHSVATHIPLQPLTNPSILMQYTVLVPVDTVI